MIGSAVTATPADLPELPEALDSEQLKALDDSALAHHEAALQGAERSALEAMSPYERVLREIRSQLAQLATETRRRERAAQVSRRASVRELAKTGGMPSLAALLAAAESPFPAGAELSSTTAFLGTGGEVGFGFPTRPGSIGFTDGRRQQQARTWDEARDLYDQGWEPGTPGIPGVRVHLAGTRVERVVPATEVVVQLG